MKEAEERQPTGLPLLCYCILYYFSIKKCNIVTVRKSQNCNGFKSEIKVLFDTFSFKKKY